MQNDDEQLNLLDKQELAKRLYHIAIIKKDGRLTLRHNQEAREAGILNSETTSGAYKTSDSYRSQIRISLGDFHALVEGEDFEINSVGDIKLLNR